MTEQQFTTDYEAPEADAAEQSMPVDEQSEDQALGTTATGQAVGEPALELPLEADPADAAEQAVLVPLDEDEYR